MKPTEHIRPQRTTPLQQKPPYLHPTSALGRRLRSQRVPTPMSRRRVPSDGQPLREGRRELSAVLQTADSNVAFRRLASMTPGQADQALQKGECLSRLPPLAFASSKDEMARLGVALEDIRALGVPATGELQSAALGDRRQPRCETTPCLTRLCGVLLPFWAQITRCTVCRRRESAESRREGGSHERKGALGSRATSSVMSA